MMQYTHYGNRNYSNGQDWKLDRQSAITVCSCIDNYYNMLVILPTVCGSDFIVAVKLLFQFINFYCL